MAVERIKTRFAPSPTGFLHLGNARIALFCALLARHARGIFLLRIEDTDRERSNERFVHDLQDDLLWLGLAWQEGPGVGGAHGPYAQSQRGAIYDRHFAILEESGQAYPCFCSEQELALARKTQLARGQPPRYAGTCAGLSSAEIKVRLEQGVRPTLRFRVPPGETLCFDDLVRGTQEFASTDIGDFILRRADGTPAFFFSNAIDDALMEVTHVLRGEDHLSNTPRQMMLLQALGVRIPRYGHVSLVVGDDAAPLSKRHGALSIHGLREAGYFPEAITNYLARLGHHYEDNNLMDLKALAAGFDLAKIGRASVRFDAAQLRHWQQESIAHADAEALWKWMGPEVHARVPEADRGPFLETIRPNISAPEQALRWADVLYRDHPELSQGARQIVDQAGSAFFEQALRALEQHQTDFKAVASEIKRETGVTGKTLFQPLRAALTGELDGPEMARLLPLLGVERARVRLRAACHCTRQDATLRSFNS